MLISAWLLLAAAALFLLQLFPTPGLLLSFLGAGVLTGTLLIASLIALAIEAIVGRAPRWLLAVPMVAFFGYYGIFAYERLQLPAVAKELNLRSTTGELTFDPARHTIDARGLSANDLLARYHIPSIYNPVGNNRRTVGKTRSCKMMSRRGDETNDWTKPLGIRLSSTGETFCFSTEEATPPEEGLISFETRHETLFIAGLTVDTQTLWAQSEGARFGAISRATVEVLMPLPVFAVGCGLLSSVAKWSCGATLFRERVEAWPQTGQEVTFASYWVRETEAVGKLLSLTPRSPEEVASMTRLP